MIGYHCVGTNDFERASAFYDALLAELGAKRTFDSPEFVAWASSPTRPAFALSKPFDGEQATVGNGSMTAILCADAKMVDKMYAKAIALGATDEGPAGARGDSGFYAGYFRDLDGNKINFFCMNG